MSNFMEQLALHYTEHLLPPRDPEQKKRDQRRDLLEREIEKALGVSFLNEYTSAFYDSTNWEMISSFQAGVRFGLRLAMATLTEDQAMVCSPPGADRGPQVPCI